MDCFSNNLFIVITIIIIIISKKVVITIIMIFMSKKSLHYLCLKAVIMVYTIHTNMSIKTR